MADDVAILDRSVLQALQEELLRLKDHFPGLRLHKTTSRPGAPFPISAKVAVPAPPSATNIDVSSVEVQATIARDAKQPGFKIEFEIVSQELPRLLRQAIRDELKAHVEKQCESGQRGAAQKVTEALHFLQSDYAQLLCLLPDYVERYESVDAEGRTIRRIAVLSDTASVIAGSDHEPAAGSPRPPPTSRPAIALPSDQGVLGAEITSIKRRYVCRDEGKLTTSIDGDFEFLAVSETAPPRSTMPVESARANSDPMRTCFTVSVVPSDPQWNPVGEAVDLVCSVDRSSYPGAGSFSVQLSSGTLSQSLSALERLVLNKLLEASVSAESGKQGALRSVIRHVENRGGGMLNQAADIVAEVVQERREQRRLGAESNSCTDFEFNSEPSYFSGAEEDDHIVVVTGEEDEEDTGGLGACSNQGGPAAAVNSDASTNRGLTMQLVGLQLENIDTLGIVTINMQFVCTRCAVLGDLSFEGSGIRQEESVTECSGCHLPWHVQLVPRIVHAGSNILAVLRNVEGCAPRDMLPSILSGQCAGCNRLAAFRGVHIGKWVDRQCGHCHHRMAFQIAETLFSCSKSERKMQNHESDSGSGRSRESILLAGRSQGASSLSAHVIYPGSPLPQNGACRHYHHSHRWYRFPCCGYRFPCDLCHEEGTDGHEMKWAHRMLCGYCSREQTLAPQCSACGKHLASSASRPSSRRTQFWEGGEGQRDQRRLSRNDPHKYRGSKGKTKSKKDLRVGEQGKSRVSRARGKKRDDGLEM